MEISDYLSLLNSLRESSLGIWANFLTVSLAVIAFVGSVKSIDIKGATLICILFLVFSFTNHTGLKKNFELREKVKSTIEAQLVAKEESSEKYSNFINEHKVNKELINQYVSSKEWNEDKLLFHWFISGLVPSLILLYYGASIWLTRRSKATA